MREHRRISWIFSITLVLFLSNPLIFSVQADADIHYMGELGIIKLDDKIKAPDFALKDLNGKELTLEDFRGKIVFLNFWATWCPPCRAEMPSMERLYSEFKGKDFAVLAVDLRERAKRVRAFKERFKLNFPILLDSDGAIGLTYGVRSIPTTYLVDKEGYLIGGALGARDWASTEAFGLINQLLKTSPAS